MATPLPIVRGSSTALYPFVQRYVCFTSRGDGQNAATARVVAGYPIVQFEFPYDPLKLADKNTLRSFVTSAKGQFSTDLSAALGATTFTDMSFDSDVFSALERKTTLYGVKWTLSQTLPQNLSPGASGGAYPQLSTGAICQRPYTQEKRFQSVVSAMPHGPKYVTAEFGGGYTGYPTDGLMSWQFAENALTDAEVDAKVAHFIANWGDAFPFSFTDEDGTVYNNVYYAEPRLEIRRMGPNQASITTKLSQESQ